MDNYTHPPKKNIHIVFQVLNFLHSDHHSAKITNSNEHRLLVNLASHKGIKGICVSIPTIAHELKLSESAVRRGLKKWDQLKVIEISENRGTTNDYFLHIPEATPVASDRGVASERGVTSDTPPLSPVKLTPVTSDRGYNKGNNKENNKQMVVVFSETEIQEHELVETQETRQVSEFFKAILGN